MRGGGLKTFGVSSLRSDVFSGSYVIYQFSLKSCLRTYSKSW